GANIDLDAIPRPNLRANNMTFEQWVRIYPGMGFVLTARDENVSEVVRRFFDVGMTAKVIGTVDSSRELRVSYNGDNSSVFDFTQNGIMRLFSDDGSCK
ncbi:MAG: AIR synthase-related protein, partial [Methanoregulaceae archaeon]